MKNPNSISSSIPYRYGVTNAFISCLDCGATFTSHKNAQTTAKQHAKKYRHNVQGELVIEVGYYGRDMPYGSPLENENNVGGPT